MPTVISGLDNLCSHPPDTLKNKRIGLLCNPASVNKNFVHAKDLILKQFPGQLTALFSPQHGFYAEKQDNMIESAHSFDPDTQIPVFSLYGETRKPLPDMLDLIDVLLVDIQDVGTRVYTFIYTLSYCMEASRDCDKPVIILDRPNPIGGDMIEGNLLDLEQTSFVGRYPIPMRHGMTIGELGLLFNQEFHIGCSLDVVPLKNWQRDMLFSNTGLPWIAPSPNMPTPATALVYPGQVIWEGTNISEGRGTTQPFEFFGAPYLNTAEMKCDMKKHLNGAFLRPVMFEPTSGKWAQTPCAGFQIHVIDPGRFCSYSLSLRFLEWIFRNHPRDFRWKDPPYEYEFEKPPIDLILGDAIIRTVLESGGGISEVISGFQKDEDHFRELRQPYLLY